MNLKLKKKNYIKDFSPLKGLYTPQVCDPEISRSHTHDHFNNIV